MPKPVPALNQDILRKIGWHLQQYFKPETALPPRLRELVERIDQVPHERGVQQ